MNIAKLNQKEIINVVGGYQACEERNATTNAVPHREFAFPNFGTCFANEIDTSYTVIEYSDFESGKICSRARTSTIIFKRW